jgi:NitT/TauT family transport system substrate-binding protein
VDCTRREFLSGLVGAGGLLGARPEAANAEPPPETTRLRLDRSPSLCVAPQFVAEDLLRGEGFTDLVYVRTERGALVAGDVDVIIAFSAPAIVRVDAGNPIVFLGGIHIGCFELFAGDQVRSIRDLKGKSVAVPGLETPPHVFVASMAAHVGLDPRRDINWVTHPAPQSMQLLVDGKIDAFLGFPPQGQQLREQGFRRVVVNSSTDRPWSQYFCCMAVGNREFVRKHPVATKRVLRAMLKATDICAREPERAARFLVDRGYAQRYDYALQTMKDVPYGKWREFDAEDTVRFYALRLHEAGMIKSSPQKLIAQGTDWRFLNELKKELKG